MTPEREREVARICEAALDRPALEREAFVVEECAGDEALRREVESLLRQQSKADEFLQRPALEVAAAQALAPHALVIGQQVGPYQIQGRLGAGGMGEVYRGHDTKLGRDVAIKILPRIFTSDPERLARFEREARLLAALNHPNIGAIYGLEEVDAVPALVLELVEGQTLADRLAKGPLPMPDALKIASQTADALGAAHERGIVHRDLKPANIKITPARVVKVLDFGLAKAASETLGPNLAGSPTITNGRTRDGAILGTPAYMSPEQARGEAVDKRTDIWAFGCVLYEMLSGRGAFAGASSTETLSEVLKTEPDWQRLPGDTPDGVRRLLRRCLAKDRTRRLTDIHDAQLDLEEAPSDMPTDARLASGARRLKRLAWAMSVLLLITATAAIGIVWRMGIRTSSPLPQVQFEIETPPTSYPDTLAISPDGRKIVFAAMSDDGRSRLWLRALDADARSAQPRTDTEGGRMAFWSPDNRSIAFSADSRLKRIDVETGTVQVLANAQEAQPGTWSPEGTILFSPFTGPVFRISDRGGAPMAVKFPWEGAHTYPRFLPDGRHFLYAAYAEGAAPRGSQGIYASQLNGSDHRRLVDGSSAEYASSGHLFYTRARTLFAQPFDPVKVELSGSPVQVAERVIAMSVATDGTIVLRSGAGAGRELAWFDRAGKEVGRPPAGDSPALSPDGSRVAVARALPGSPRADVWILDLARNRSSTVTVGPGSNNSPLWSPDGVRIAYASARGKPFALYERSATGGGEERLLLETPQNVIPNDWSPDGRFLIYRSSPSTTDMDLWVLSLADQHTRPLVKTEFVEREAQFSPDGRWFAYQSNESGQFEIYLRPFPNEGRMRIGPISSNGGVQVRWRRDGRELFYIALDNMLMAVPVHQSPTGEPIAEPPVPLFRTNIGAGDGVTVQDYAVSKDGTRFLINNLKETTLPLKVILNWKPKP
jgi:eukaryotic-like serine/threonine-protein kinase